jgi:hypothetical protein
MSGEPLPAALAAFVQGDVSAAQFHHRDHVRVGFEMLGRHAFLDAATAFAAGLKRISARAGHPGAYHETITVAFLALIAERRAAAPEGDFAAFAAANPDLMDKGVLARWYSAGRLASNIARRTFILPDSR